MSEFPEWLEQQKGPWWSPTYEKAQQIHRMLKDGMLQPPPPLTFWQKLRRYLLALFA